MDKDLMKRFEAAVARAEKYADNHEEDKVQLYALRMQATVGDNVGTQPWAVQLDARAKWDAWMKLKGKDESAAANEYITLVEKNDPGFWIDVFPLLCFFLILFKPPFLSQTLNIVVVALLGVVFPRIRLLLLALLVIIFSLSLVIPTNLILLWKL
jgi:diazepam-binding inhibitor (GABA receptor modulating acyl-CoA-binding protein)